MKMIAQRHGVDLLGPNVTEAPSASQARETSRVERKLGSAHPTIPPGAGGNADSDSLSRRIQFLGATGCASAARVRALAQPVAPGAGPDPLVRGCGRRPRVRSSQIKVGPAEHSVTANRPGIPQFYRVG